MLPVNDLHEKNVGAAYKPQVMMVHGSQGKWLERTGKWFERMWLYLNFFKYKNCFV